MACLTFLRTSGASWSPARVSVASVRLSPYWLSLVLAVVTIVALYAWVAYVLRTKDHTFLSFVRELNPAKVSAGPDGKASLPDLFDGRRQLLLYHFMFAPGVNGWPTAGCPGCSFFADQVGHLSHLHARDVSLVLVSRAPLANIQAYKKRMGWTVPWFSSAGSEFNADFGLTNEAGEHHGLSVFLRDGDSVFRTYFTTARGVEPLGSTWTFLDLTPFGRQESWEDSPKGWPQSAPYQWWHRHDEY